MIDFSRLPPGLEMTPDGVISGIPTVERSFAPMFRVEDDRNRVDTKVIPLRVTSGRPGDLDGDDDVDLNDFATFATCYGFPVSAPAPGCSPEDAAACDLNGDGTVELNDFATFAVEYTG